MDPTTQWNDNQPQLTVSLCVSNAPIYDSTVLVRTRTYHYSSFQEGESNFETHEEEVVPSGPFLLVVQTRKEIVAAACACDDLGQFRGPLPFVPVDDDVLPVPVWLRHGSETIPSGRRDSYRYWRIPIPIQCP